MTHSHISIATIYSSAQCVLSVVGSVGVILLFAGIPQLIYSPSVSTTNLLTFITGAVLIVTMVAGNSFLNYKYRSLGRNRQGGQGESGDGSAGSSGNPDDKPPSYESVLTLDGLPPEYSSIVAQKPPRYEEIMKETYTACGSLRDMQSPTTCQSQAQAATPQLHGEASPSPRHQRIVVTLSKVEEEEDVENTRITNDERRDVLETTTGNEESQNMNERVPSSENQPSVASELRNCLDREACGESET